MSDVLIVAGVASAICFVGIVIWLFVHERQVESRDEREWKALRAWGDKTVKEIGSLQQRKEVTNV